MSSTRCCILFSCFFPRHFSFCISSASLHKTSCARATTGAPESFSFDNRTERPCNIHACFSSGNASHAKHASSKRSQVLRLRYVTRCLQPTRAYCVYRHRHFQKNIFGSLFSIDRIVDTRRHVDDTIHMCTILWHSSDGSQPCFCSYRCTKTNVLCLRRIA